MRRLYAYAANECALKEICLIRVDIFVWDAYLLTQRSLWRSFFSRKDGKHKSTNEG